MNFACKLGVNKNKQLKRNYNMALIDKLLKLSEERNNPCVTISFNTHRTHSDSLKDEIVMKKLLLEAEKRVIEEFGKRPVAKLLENMEKVPQLIDRDRSLDSLHIFLSNDTLEIIKIAWPASEDMIQIADRFNIRTLIKSYNRVSDYLILLLSQGGVRLYSAVNECIIDEFKNEDFPFDENPYYVENRDRRSDSKAVDNKVREYYNEVDKAVVRVYNQSEMKCVVCSTEDNYSFLKEVADKPDIYIGHVSIDYNNIKPHQLAEQAWKVIEEEQRKIRFEAIKEMEEAVGDNKVLTGLDEIYLAALEGRGDLLIVRDDYVQSVKKLEDNKIEIVNNNPGDDVIDDITSDIAWEVLSKGGRVFFTCQDEIKKLGNIVLKTRY